MQKILKYFLILSFVFIANGCNSDDLKPAMAAFDQAFIPVLYYSHYGDLESAQKAMLVLDRKWETLSVELHKHATSYHKGPELIQLITAWLEEARCAIEYKDPLRALIQLDHARYEMTDFRWREGMVYYLDKVWDLEAAIDIVVQTVNDPKLDLLEWSEFMPMCYEVEIALDELMQTPMEKDLFGFTATDELRLTSQLSVLHFSIKNFIVATEYGDSGVVAEAANKMQTAYLEYIYLFGEFEPTTSFFALN